MKYYVIVISLLAFLVVGTSFRCYHRDYPEPTHQFREKVKVIPNKKTFAINDTMWISMVIPGKKLLDSLTNTRIFMDSLNMDFRLSLNMVYNNPLILGSGQAEMIFPSGLTANVSDYNGKTYSSLSFGCATGSTDYSFRIGIVFKKKGAFVLFINDGYSAYSNTMLYNCNAIYADAAIGYSFDVADTYTDYYAKLPFDSIGTKIDTRIVENLQNKKAIAIEVK